MLGSMQQPLVAHITGTHPTALEHSSLRQSPLPEQMARTHAACCNETIQRAECKCSFGRSMLSPAHCQSCVTVTEGNALLQSMVCVHISTHAQRGLKAL